MLITDTDLIADCVLENCNIINVLTKEILPGDIALTGSVISGIGDVSGIVDSHTVRIDMEGRYASPGFIDGHVHFESSLVTLTRFAEKALTHGTAGIVADPHEIANVLGKKGIGLILREAESLPVDVFLTVPSCVPASGLETSGAHIGVREAGSLFGQPDVIGLGEMMDYRGVIGADPEKLAMISEAQKRNLRIDGHAPGIRGSELFRYMYRGISSDHESLELDEALEKARFGMAVMLREGSAAGCLSGFIPGLLQSGVSLESFFFVSDDTSPSDLMLGHMDAIVRRAVSLGLDPIQAIAMCTINTARHFRIDHKVGSISIGRRAFIVILDDIETIAIHGVFTGKKRKQREIRYPAFALDTVQYRTVMPHDLWIASQSASEDVNVISIIPGKLLTEHSIETLDVENSIIQPDIERDILAACVVERHGKRGSIGRGFISGLSLNGGAVGQSIAHDSHNVIVAGTDFSDMALCANTINKMHGGLVLARDGKILGSLALPFAGILSPLSVDEVAVQLASLEKIIKEMGCALRSPFSALSFLTLPVIPRYRLTDLGVVDVENSRLIEPVVSEKSRRVHQDRNS